ncbi:hypothetical protein AWM70_03260 [Paenibacillus yonginensis]|uniref:DUF2634 domain-containing protein n=1 Tax=Paenibacillus yonginensis TaxID=1462996 RepID=A0A1B1MX02_9BACL|nr:DUF2634 domain-containing protein [Paenibacillus yonginensis]ANS73712.1 hypothetical protein AWM70_03260 [Paenibacillus yonginensis]
MESLKLEADGDVSFEIISGQEELAQCCRIVLGTKTGEWFLNPDSGLDYSLFLGKDINETQMNDALSTALLQEERITSVESVSLSIDRKARTLTAGFKATGMDGAEILLEEVEVGAG